MAKKKIILRCEIVYEDQKTTPDKIAELVESFINNNGEYQDYGHEQFEIKEVYYPYKKENK